VTTDSALTSLVHSEQPAWLGFAAEKGQRNICPNRCFKLITRGGKVITLASSKPQRSSIGIRFDPLKSYSCDNLT